MKYMRECLYDVEWQKIRMSCLGGWNADAKEVGVNLKTVTNYALMGADHLERPVRYWRVLNLLNAVLLAYSQRQIDVNNTAVMAVRDAANYFSDLHEKHPIPTVVGQKGWDWDKVADDLARADKRFLSRLLVNLQHRAKTAVYRRHDPEVTRPELMLFIELIICTLNPEPAIDLDLDLEQEGGD